MSLAAEGTRRSPATEKRVMPKMQSMLALLYVICALWLALPAKGQGLNDDTTSQLLGATDIVATADMQQAYKQALAIQKNLAVELRKATNCKSGCLLKSSGDSSPDVNPEKAPYRLLLSPLTWDSRDSELTYGVSVIPPSIDQRPCSTCTAMAVTSAAETAVAMTLRKNVADEEMSLSAMSMYYCSDKKRKCQDGAELKEVLEYLSTGKTLSESCLPYQAYPDLSYSICESKTCSRSPLLALKGKYDYQPLRNPYDVMDFIIQHGSVVIPFDINDDFKAFYNDTANQQEIYIYPANPQSQPGAEGHAMVLVGYNLDFEHFNESYWIVKNSWGPEWADNGYFKLSYNFSNIFPEGLTYGITWTPEPDELPDYTPLEGLTAASKPGCCLYQVTAYDLLSRIAAQAREDPLQLLADNPDIKFPSSNLSGITLQLCNSLLWQETLAVSGGGQGQNYAVTLRNTVKNSELGCNYIDEFGRHVDYCRVCGGVQNVAVQCDANPECESFDMEDQITLKNGTVKWCGYLKKATRPLEYMENYANYCKLSKGNNCQLQDTYIYKRGLSLPAADVDCNYKNKDGIKQPKCFVVGYMSNVMSSCNNNPKCKAFEYVTGSSYGGWLKSSSDAFVSTSGAGIYVSFRNLISG